MGGIDHSGAFGYTAHSQHDAQAFLRLCAARFLAAGYRLTGQGHGWISAARGMTGPGAVNMSGYPIMGASALSQAHTIAVRADGWAVHFEIRGQMGFGFMFVPELDRACGETLAAYDSWSVQQAIMGPPSSPHGYPPPASVHVVEKQVVVVRCKFCQAHTPLDAVTCKACGAVKFT